MTIQFYVVHSAAQSDDFIVSVVDVDDSSQHATITPCASVNAPIITLASERGGIGGRRGLGRCAAGPVIGGARWKGR